MGAEKAGVGRTRIITGRGNHSEGGVAKIKPEVQRYLREQGISVQETSQGGAMEIELPTDGEGHGKVKKGGLRELLKVILRKLLSGR